MVDLASETPKQDLRRQIKFLVLRDARTGPNFLILKFVVGDSKNKSSWVQRNRKPFGFFLAKQEAIRWETMRNKGTNDFRVLPPASSTSTN